MRDEQARPVSRYRLKTPGDTSHRQRVGHPRGGLQILKIILLEFSQGY